VHRVISQIDSAGGNMECDLIELSCLILQTSTMHENNDGSIKSLEEQNRIKRSRLFIGNR